jgi:hypothetical protein
VPWQECAKMDERFKFVARLLDENKMAVLCREFEISRIRCHAADSVVTRRSMNHPSS